MTCWYNIDIMFIRIPEYLIPAPGHLPPNHLLINRSTPEGKLVLQHQDLTNLRPKSFSILPNPT